MRAPGFWWRPRRAAGVASLALLPLAAVWTLTTRLRLAHGAWARLPVPVICVGNLSIGGTGKTPTVVALVERLGRSGIAAHVLSRGHGGRIAGPVRVEPARHSASDVGDEPLLSAAFAPTWVARDRLAGAQAAIAAGAEAIVMDDGLQNPSLRKDLSIIVVDAETGFGNGRAIPAGPLRETVDWGLARGDLVVSLGAAAAQHRLAQDWPEIARLPRIEARLEVLETGMDWQGRKVLAFAGIGRPEKFFASLAAAGADIAATRAFDDHAEYPPAILQRLAREAKDLGAQLVTTEKDAVRLPDDFRRNVLVLPVRLTATDWTPLDAALDALPRTGTASA